MHFKPSELLKNSRYLSLEKARLLVSAQDFSVLSIVSTVKPQYPQSIFTEFFKFMCKRLRCYSIKTYFIQIHAIPPSPSQSHIFHNLAFYDPQRNSGRANHVTPSTDSRPNMHDPRLIVAN